MLYFPGLHSIWGPQNEAGSNTPGLSQGKMSEPLRKVGESEQVE
jgi:hypothetical protein